MIAADIIAQGFGMISAEFEYSKGGNGECFILRMESLQQKGWENGGQKIKSGGNNHLSPALSARKDP